MTAKMKKVFHLSLAVAVGAAAFAFIPYEASAEDTVLVCYRGRTLSMPQSIAARYYAAGATPGACNTSGT